MFLHFQPRAISRIHHEKVLSDSRVPMGFSHPPCTDDVLQRRHYEIDHRPDFHVDPADIQEMDLISLRRELSRCYKALITLQNRNMTHGQSAGVDNDVAEIQDRLLSAEQSIASKDSMIIEIAQAANEMSQCSQKQLELMNAAYHKNAMKISGAIDSIGGQVGALEQVNNEILARLGARGKQSAARVSDRSIFSFRESRTRLIRSENTQTERSEMRDFHEASPRFLF
jgi:hypothetical protein